MLGRENYSDWAKDCYSPDWDKISRRAKDLTNDKCCLCGGKAKISHHAFYTEFGSKDSPGYNIFPLCSVCHSSAHIKGKRGNWIVTNPNDPIKGRFNTEKFIARLRRGFIYYSNVDTQKQPTIAHTSNTRYTEKLATTSPKSSSTLRGSQAVPRTKSIKKETQKFRQTSAKLPRLSLVCFVLLALVSLLIIVVIG